MLSSVTLGILRRLTNDLTSVFRCHAPHLLPPHDLPKPHHKVQMDAEPTISPNMLNTFWFYYWKAIGKVESGFRKIKKKL